MDEVVVYKPWRHPFYWQKVKGHWHADDSSTGRLVTLCGREYRADEPETHEEPKRWCRKCKSLMTRKLLTYGQPYLKDAP